MSVTIGATSILTSYVKLTNNTATDVLPDVSQAVVVLSIACHEIGGNTPNLTIEVYDPKAPATSYYRRNAVAMAARQIVETDLPFTVPNGWELRVTSSHASGLVDVWVSYVVADAQRRGPV